MISIVEMGQEQAFEVASISAACFSAPWSEDAVASELQNPFSRTYIAIADGVVIGFINAHFILDEVYINNIAVTKTFRENGVGEKLLDTIIQKAIEDKSSFVTLEVRESNYMAIKFYEKFDFVLQGIRKNFYQKPVENAIIYTRNII